MKDGPAGMVDLLIVGGGVNGTAIARDAIGRGLSVVLCEKGDLAGETSSRSSKLIHGGLRYLEHFAFRLVGEALAEREVLMRTAPHVVWPQEFVLPHTGDLRPAWMLRAGLFIYDHLGGNRTLPGCRSLDLTRSPFGKPLRPGIQRGFSYYDCRADDARLVVLNALAASQAGAEILPRTAFLRATSRDRIWYAQLRDVRTGQEREVAARMIVNVAGPWANEVLEGLLGQPAPEKVRSIKGSHVVVPKLYDGDQAYILQNKDKRVLFVIPFEQDFTLIGNTDVAHDGKPGPVEISPEEIEYLCAGVSRDFDRRVDPSEIVWTYAGLRPLFDDSRSNVSAITRDYVMRTYQTANSSPILSIFGGKLTTARQLAARALQTIAEFFPMLGPAWTHERPLPGGDMPGADFSGFVATLERAYPQLSKRLLYGYARRYGTRAHHLLGPRQNVSELGIDFGGGLYEREVRFLMEHEWAITADDVLWRRTKLGLRVPPQGASALEAWMAKVANAAAGDKEANVSSRIKVSMMKA